MSAAEPTDTVGGFITSDGVRLRVAERGDRGAGPVLVLVHGVLICTNGQTYHAYSDMGKMLALAWNSAPTKELKNTSAGIEKRWTWKHVVKVEECDGDRLQLTISNNGNEDCSAHLSPRVGIEYS